MSDVVDPGATGALDPFVLDGAITGWARPGARVRITIDGAPAGETTADRLRLSALRPPPDPRNGFTLAAPALLFDGLEHVVRALDIDDGRELDGGPLRFRTKSTVGRIERPDGNLLFGRAHDPAEPEREVAVAALVGHEVVAVAVAGQGSADDGGGGGRGFRLILPENLLRSGAGFVHVVALGSDVRLEGSPVLLPWAPPIALHPRPSRQRTPTLAIKIAAPSLKVAHEWGDFHFAVALGAALERRGWVVRIDCADAWAREGDDAVLVLRGRHRYKPRSEQANLLWIISHPDRLRAGEADSFDHIFVAAQPYARVLARSTRRPVEVLHQATDPSVFSGEMPVEPPAPVLFVGNSRRENRRMVRWCVEEGIDVAVYGTLWQGLIPDRLIRGEHIANDVLDGWYAGAGVLLNDHWDTMLSGGFLSNRLFDGSAAGAFIITDPVAGLAEVFGDSIETADSAAELAEKVKLYLAEPERARAKAEAARALVLAAHTFDHRAKVIERTLQALLRARAS